MDASRCDQVESEWRWRLRCGSRSRSKVEGLRTTDNVLARGRRRHGTLGQSTSAPIRVESRLLRSVRASSDGRESRAEGMELTHVDKEVQIVCVGVETMQSWQHRCKCSSQCASGRYREPPPMKPQALPWPCCGPCPGPATCPGRSPRSPRREVRACLA